MSTMVAGPGPAYYNSENNSRHSQTLDGNELAPVALDPALVPHSVEGGQIVDENGIIMTSLVEDLASTTSATVAVVSDFCPGQYPTPPIPATQAPYPEFYPGDPYFPGPPMQDYSQHPSMCAIHGVPGPATVRMVSTNSTPPIPLPVQMPPGHIVQQIVDRSGTLQHVILSTQPLPLSVCSYGPNGNHAPHQYYSPPPGPQAQGWGPSGIPSYQPPPQYTPVMSPSLSQSSPPPHNYQKQDRNAGPHEKIRGKYNPKYQPPIQSNKKSCPNSFSPKKEILKKTSGGKEQMNGSLTPDPQLILHQLLSEIEAPEVYDITTNCAMVQWKPPDLSSCPEEALRGCNVKYEVFLRNYLHASQEETHLYLSKLRPGAEYKVHFVCTYNDVRGRSSPTKVFYTKRTRPDTPQAPKLVERTKNTLFFRWPVPRDNGAKIINYIIEIIGGDYKSWTGVYSHFNKQYNITKLKPQTTYTIRLAAVNELGKSDFSSEVTETTSSPAPSQPSAPSLAGQTVTSLSIEWIKRIDDVTFTLQMEDPFSGYGFQPVFNGRENRYTCTNLERNSTYKFRLCTQNMVGNSPFSGTVAYQTLSDRSSPPVRVSLKGNPSPTSLTVCWSQGVDDGGTPVHTYELQIDKENGYESAYCGSALECSIRNLTPGQSYKVRCAGENGGGKSYWSEEATVTTRAVAPNKCSPPRLAGKPKSTTLELKWGYPDFDGGSPVSEFNLDIVNSDTERRHAYSGKETECLVASLLPGRSYVFLLRAVNKIGAGAWSEPFEVVSGAGPPDSPKAPQLTFAETERTVTATWDEPINNGAGISQYCLQSCQVEKDLSSETDVGANALSTLPFDTVYTGLSNNVAIENLTPATVFAIRVNASNNAGAGPWSRVSYVTMPAAAPAVVYDITSHTGSTDVLLKWAEPACHGEPIQHYVIECADRTFSTNGCVQQYTVSDLEPETLYKFRIRAVNCVGEGVLSSIHKTSTGRVPPKAPTIELLKASHNSLKLKWGDGRNVQLLKFHLQMECLTIQKSMEFYQIYYGSNESYKVNKLEESSTYKFKICASNEAGTGALSDIFEFSTLRAPPALLKPPKVSESQSGTICVAWNPVRSCLEDKITYKVQLMKVGKDNDYAQIYVGPELSYILSNVECERSYYVRACAVRTCSNGEVMVGGYSLPTFFSTPKMSHSARTDHSSVMQRKEKKLEWSKLTENQKAFAMVLLFSILAFVAAYFVSPSAHNL